MLAWDGPTYGSYYRIDNYTIERKNETSDSFRVVKTLPYIHTRSQMKMGDLEPGTEYTIRLTSNNYYGKSDGVLIKQTTLPGKNY